MSRKRPRWMRTGQQPRWMRKRERRRWRAERDAITRGLGIAAQWINAIADGVREATVASDRFFDAVHRIRSEGAPE